jgi:DNA repair exonuclease SbcCD ATPase subunit
MPDRANVTSVDALKSFRANLIVYQAKARPTLEEVTSEVSRVRIWLETDQRTRWEAEVRRRKKRLEEAQQAVFSANLSILRDITTAEQLAVQKAKRALEEAEGKLKILKQWNREFESRVEPLVKQLEKLHTVLSNDIPKAAAYLTQAANTLEEYAGITPSAASEKSPPPNSQQPVVESTRSVVQADPSLPEPAGQGIPRTGKSSA